MYETDSLLFARRAPYYPWCGGSIAGLAIQQLPCHFTAFSLLLTSCTICELNLFLVISLCCTWDCHFFSCENLSKQQQFAHAAADCMFSCSLAVTCLPCPISNWCRLNKIDLSADGFCRRYNNTRKNKCCPVKTQDGCGSECLRQSSATKRCAEFGTWPSFCGIAIWLLHTRSLPTQVTPMSPIIFSPRCKLLRTPFFLGSLAYFG